MARMNTDLDIKEIYLERYKGYIPEIIEILQYEANDNCADCLSPNVQCICLSTLVILCEKCAYAHLKYGFEVKLLSEKTWDSQILNALRLNSNATSRAFYEHTKPSWQLTPFNFDSRIVRENWIKQKYNDKEFVKKAIEGENEESVYKKMMKKMEDMEKKKTQEELIKNNWYYLEPEEHEVKQVGPLTRPEIVNLLNTGQIDESFYCWHPTSKEWEQIVDVPELGLDKRNFKVIKETRSPMNDVTPDMLKFIPRVLRGFLECRSVMFGPAFKRFWAVFTNDYLLLYKNIPSEKEKSPKPDYTIRISGEDWVVEPKEVTKEKGKVALAFDLCWTNSIYTLTADESLETIEWIHNFRKYLLFRAKFNGRLPIYEDKLNPYRSNILEIEKNILTKLKCGYLLKEPSGFWESGFQTRWFELTLDQLIYYDTPKDATPKNQFTVTKDWKVVHGTEPSKYSSSSHLFHFQIEMGKNNILHLWENSDENRHDWINTLHRVINMKKKKQNSMI